MRGAVSMLLVLVSCMRGKASVDPTDAEPPQAAEHHGPAMAGHHRPHDLTHRFDDAEAWAEHFDDPQRDAWQRPDAVIEALELEPDAVVADLGAGTGYFTVRLARAIPKGRVLAIDVEPAMVRHLEERAASEGLSNVVAMRNTHDDPGLTETVDVVFMCNVAHHIADRVSFFRSISQHLADGGRVVIVDFRPDAPEGTPGPPPRHRISIDQLTRELGEAGLELAARDAKTLPYQYIATYRLRS